MHIALQGALIGAGVAVLLIAAEYFFVKKQVRERATVRNLKPEFEEQDRNRIKSIASFALFLPPALALGFWLVWG
jgi:uncharacterized membrane protein YvbJ